MNISINKSAKRVLSIALALVMLVGTLFTANVVINVSAEASNIVYWNGGTDTTLSGSGTDEDPYLITNAEELAALTSGKLDLTKHYKVSGVSTFYLVPESYKAIIDSLNTADDIRSFLSSDFDDITNWPCSATFEGVLDGNGATIYGMSVKNAANGGLFATLKGATIKNIGIEKSYISTTNNAGAISGQGSWSRPDTTTYSPTTTITGCVVKDCYIMATNSRGGLMGNAGYSGLVINNCLVADNFVGNAGAADGYPAFVSGSDTDIGGTINVPAVISNSIGIGIIPKAGDVNGASHKEVINCYSTHSMTYNVSNVQLKSNLSAASLKGIASKSTASSLNWATDSENGAGYWHILENDYPTPLKPAGWQDIVVHPVWDGTAADSFAGGSGTEEDPYIIETAEQLYKMVKDGGRIWNDGDVVSYTPAYYKVGNGITDIYLNSVQGGNLDTLKGLVTAKTAKNWSKGFNADTNTLNDLDNDGLADESAAFIGVFDGNGVTIHGLYSTTEDSTYIRSAWTSCSGIGFVPALTGNAVIKNVSFDKSYIYSQYFQAAVVTTSFGLDNNGEEQYGSLGTKIKSKFYNTANVSLYNVSVRNAYVFTGNSASWTGGTAGIVASHNCAPRASFINCFFDGYSSEINTGGSNPYYNAGLFSGPTSLYGYRVINSVSLGLYPMPNNTNITLTNMQNVGFTNSYTDIEPVENLEFKLEAPKTVEATNIYTADMMPLLNWGIWSLKTVENGRVIPMPGVTGSNIVGYDSIKDMVLEQVGEAGLYSYSGAYEKGTYGHYDKLTGSGTEADPYLITNALELANAIATGGKNTAQKLHYKLTNDINLGSLSWIDTETVTREAEGFDEYRYTPFEGVLDGNGYTIYELNATAENCGALIPELKGGTIKNLHIRNSAANAAIFANGVGVIENCSAVNCYVATDGCTLVAGGATVKNSVFDDTYYLADGTVGTPVLDGVIWYGIAGKAPHLVNNAKSMPYADIDGDGIGDAYGATDLAALKNALLRKQDYEYVYGDVNKDGKINSADLVMLIRATSDDYNHVKDGFWRNLELGNFNIYYGENDNYDVARKLELYLEASVPGLDVKKVVSADNTVTGANVDKTAVYVHANDSVGTPDGNLEIIVGNIANYDSYAINTKATASNSYAITYDKDKGVLWLQGDNFTAVEQAVLDFINNSDAKASTVYTVDSATLSKEKQPVTIDGTTYYYTWGDEFNGDELIEDTWLYSQMGSETAYENGTHEGKYVNLEHPFNKELSQLYVVDNGKLTIKRGAYVDSVNGLGIVKLDAPDFGDADYLYNEQGNKIDKDDIYVSSGDILSEKSLLVKQGYFEFKAALPSDGHAFMSWWMMGVPTGGNNNAYTHSLYGKVYKLNPYFNGTNQMDSQNALNTYKYQLPNAYFEIDILELLQDITRLSTNAQKTHMTGIYDYELQFNMHKYFDTGANTGNGYKYSVIDWETGAPKPFTLLEGSKYLTSNYKTVTYIEIEKNGSDNNRDGIMSVLTPNGAKEDFGNNGSYTYNATAQEKMTAMRRYGFEWEVESDENGVGTKATYTLYVWDPDGNGEDSATDYHKYTVTCDKTTSQITYNEISASPMYTTYHTDLYYLNQLIPDCEVANQYMHFIIDNIYYVANQYNNNANFTDLLTYENTDKTTLDIDYLRVYQQDGKRDIITPETEDFNNGNHFGY